MVSDRCHKAGKTTYRNDKMYSTYVSITHLDGFYNRIFAANSKFSEKSPAFSEVVGNDEKVYVRFRKNS